MRELYELIADALGTVTGIRSVAVWNNQLQNEEKELALFLPALFFSVQVRWAPQSSGVRKGYASVTVRVATEIYQTSEEIGSHIAYLDIVDEVYKKLGKKGFIPVSDQPDTNHDNVQVHVSGFDYQFTDETLKRTNQAGTKLQKVSTNLKIEK